MSKQSDNQSNYTNSGGDKFETDDIEAKLNRNLIKQESLNAVNEVIARDQSILAELAKR